MAPMQHKLRQALGSLKDQTSISLAKVASTGAPDLDVALVKATSHEEVPIEEKYIQEILHLTSFSRAYISACIAGLARRLSKTHNWIVAVKTLMLAHRLLRDGDLAFEQELMVSGRRGLRVLYVADFRDDAHSHGWDYSAFVRTYGMYLDERLDCSIGSLASRARPEKRSSYNESRYEYSDSGYYEDEYRSGRDHEDRDRKRDESQQKSKTVKDIPVPHLLEEFPVFQRLLERVLACRPTGAAKTNRLVQIALYPVVRESFLLYNDIRDGLAILFDAFFDMEQRDCSKVFEIFNRAAKQISELIAYYSFCKALGVCRSSEYPAVERISEEMLETMEDFVRNRSDSGHSRRPKSPEPRPRSPPRVANELADEEAYEVNGMKALPAPPLKDVPEAATEVAHVPKPVVNDDLINVYDPVMSSEEHEDRLALALFSGKETSGTSKWEAFSSTEDQETANSASTNGAAGWELALVESNSDMSRKPNGKALAGGFDNLLLDSMYDQAVDRQKFASATAPSGSASSVAMPGRPQSSFLALPAPPVAGQSGTDDPFAASVCVPPPAYVQMADLKQKQQHLVHEQQQWLQYQQDGMQGYHGLMKFSSNPYFAPYQQNAFTVPSHGYGANSYYR